MRDRTIIVLVALLAMGATTVLHETTGFPKDPWVEGWVALAILIGFVIGKWFSGEKP